MIITRFHGGLGNQMFQYATGRALAIKHGTQLLADSRCFRKYRLHSYSIDRYNTRMQEAAKANLAGLSLPPGSQNSFTCNLWELRNRGRLRYFRERGIGYNADFETLGDHTYLRGYWQSEKYFRQYAPQLREELTRPEPASPENLSTLDEMKQTAAISLHIRRGDYVSDPKANKVHGICSLEYYREAASYIAQHCDQNPTFFVFSDDPDWCHNNLKLPHPMRLVTHNSVQDPWGDLLLMSRCEHNIVANSSFSWWGAWLNPNPDKIVVACRNWFSDSSMDDRDLVPESWVRLGADRQRRAAA